MTRALTSALLVGVLVIQGCGSSTAAPAPTGTIMGRVIDTTMVGIADVTIAVTPTGGHQLPNVATDGNGNYRVDQVPAGAGTVAVHSAPLGCSTPQATFQGLRAGDRVTVNLTIACRASTGTVTGIVTDVSGKPIVGAAVVVQPFRLNAWPAVLTDTNGAYTVDTVPIGSGNVTATYRFCKTASYSTYSNLGPNGSVHVNLTGACPLATAASVPVAMYLAVRPDGGASPYPGTAGGLFALSSATLAGQGGPVSLTLPLVGLVTTLDTNGNVWTVVNCTG